MIVIKEVYLTSWSKCLFRINSLFLIETSSHKSFLSSTYFILQIHLEDTTFLLSGLSTSFQYSFIIASSMSSSCQVINISHFTLGKFSIHHEAIHHVVLCRTQISSVVTPPEVEYHLPSSFYTGGSMLDIYLSIEYVMSQSILSEANHEPLLCTLVLVDPEDTTYFPLCLEIISYTSFPMINCYSLIIEFFSSS